MDRLPEEWLEDRALLARRMSTDAPMGDIDLDEQEWDADRVRQLWNTPSPIWVAPWRISGAGSRTITRPHTACTRSKNTKVKPKVSST